jgi:hypothetical protein
MVLATSCSCSRNWSPAPPHIYPHIRLLAQRRHSPLPSPKKAGKTLRDFKTD